MKFILLALLFSTVSLAGEIQTTLSESGDGLSFSLYELSNVTEVAPLSAFAQSLNQKDMITSDKNFSFRCKQKTSVKSFLETRCTGVLKDATHVSAQGDIGVDYITINLIGRAAEEFFNMLPKQGETVAINVENKLFLAGSKSKMGILVRH